ncbi:multiple organellar RNA editing factor 1, mitochondrial-like [Mercurialis annua]|uniref:multiple organellar RNA editing factor 1, mitochondrial-like n=1 Tax=Mercurialis annua TaxID=3986 RepID=UPI00215F3AA6|nr:multiple organellar RNA editing factor 1, mitochondrial-like [Mercurialis annua]
MALQLTRLRRALTSLSTLHRSQSSTIITPTSPPLPLPQSHVQPPLICSPFQTRLFRVSGPSLTSLKDIMVDFEGCDFNHWMIVVHFPGYPAPTPEEMVATYERICAEGLGIRRPI